MEKSDVKYDTFSAEQYKRVEKIVLKGNKFNEEQKKFIYHLKSAVIEAGPGSGKTTALAAKVGLLLNKIEKGRGLEGICVITHTNAAVDEILSMLKKMGYKDIPHPHFIGTIHSFFNKYLLPKIFYQEISKKTLRFVDRIPDWDIKSSIKERHPWLSPGPLTSVVRRFEKIKYSVELFPFRIKVKNTEDWNKFSKYKDTFKNIIRERIVNGLLLHDDTLKITNQYLKKSMHVHKLLTNRFQYVFIDEYQDTDPVSLDNLINVFNNNKNTIQLIGDLNQHIYYELSPLNKIDLPQFKINTTNRFGDKVTIPLNRVFNSNLTAKGSKKSKKPILLIYNSSNILMKSYTDILNNLSMKNDSITPIVLVSQHDHARHLKKSLSNAVTNKTQNILPTVLNDIYKALTDKLDISIKTLKSLLILEYKDYHININKSLIDVLRGNLNSLNDLKDTMNSLLTTLGAKSLVNKNNVLFKEIKFLTKDTITEKETENEIQIKTVHSVKGQTLKTNMVYLSEGSVEEYGFLSTYDSSFPEPDRYREINKRVVYVAMSRSTTLLIVSLHQNSYDKLTEQTKAILQKDFHIQKEINI